ncbi:hypothetical protein Sjap_018566 [Stephania japonica]|uniref:SHSP domain-containing protein n=1 Tax=Stephania japonica TaxID=461633 RepID=A0AAP0I906_9MAGN
METSSMFPLLALFLLCTTLFNLSHSKTIVVDGLSEWRNPSVLVGDTIIFDHKSHYKLYIFQNRGAFQLCNFTQATLLTKSNSTSFTWHPSRPGFFYFAFNNGSLKSCERNDIFAIRVSLAPPQNKTLSPEMAPVSAPSPTQGGVVSSSPVHHRPFQGSPNSSKSPGTIPPVVPDAGGGIPFINSNPAVPLPTGETDAATIRPLPTSGHGGKVVGLLPVQIPAVTMELELGLKITRTGEESTSTDLRIAKDRTGPVFFSTETEKMFILTVHLKGFKREKIKIEINDDGTRIAISGERPVREMVLVRWKMCQKETEIVGFRKVFRIPNGVRLDLIKARFDEEECILTISMPKSVKGIVGTGIEEIKEGEKSETTHDEQNTPQPESEQQQQQPHPIKETLTPIRSAEIGVAHETEEIIPERIQESTGEEVVRESIEIDSKPPDPAFRSKETPPPPPSQEQELQEHEPNPVNPQQTTVEQIRSEPEPDRAVERSEEQIEQENRAEEEESSEGEASPRRARVEAALDEQNLRSEQESDESEEEEEEEEERGVESKRGGGFGGAYICAGSAVLIGLLIVLMRMDREIPTGDRNFS